MNNEDKMNKEIWTKEDILRDYDDAGISGRSKQDYLESIFEKAEKYDRFIQAREMNKYEWELNALEYIFNMDDVLYEYGRTVCDNLLELTKSWCEKAEKYEELQKKTKS